MTTTATPKKPQFSLSKASAAKLVGVHPDLVKVVQRAIAVTEQDFSIGEGVRTVATQRRYVAQKKSQTMASKHLKQADGFGHAVDLWAYEGGVKWDERFYYPIMRAMCQAAHELEVEVRTGACWVSLLSLEPTNDAMRGAVADYVAVRRKAGKSSFLDFVHFEI